MRVKSGKTCKECKESKALSEFYKHPTCKLGVHSYCKNCFNSRCRVFNMKRKILDPVGYKKRQDESSKKWYMLNKDTHAERSKKRHVALRSLVLSTLSLQTVPQCGCCGEINIKFLAVDHINNDGYKDRGKYIYDKVRNEGFPKDRYQVLCHNCNMAKAFYGECPHRFIIKSYARITL